MQTHEWEALLDGTTPGPWEAREDHGGMNLFAGSERVFGSDSCGDVSGQEEDVRLAAHAPAAVAEVIRLRKAIATMRDRHLAQIAAASYITDDVLNAQFIADDLTRILEGEA